MRCGVDETPLAGLDLEPRDRGRELRDRGQAHGARTPCGVRGELLDHRDAVLLEQRGQRRDGAVKRPDGVIAGQQERLPLQEGEGDSGAGGRVLPRGRRPCGVRARREPQQDEQEKPSRPVAWCRATVGLGGPRGPGDP